MNTSDIKVCQAYVVRLGCCDYCAEHYVCCIAQDLESVKKFLVKNIFKSVELWQPISENRWDIIRGDMRDNKFVNNLDIREVYIQRELVAMSGKNYALLDEFMGARALRELL